MRKYELASGCAGRVSSRLGQATDVSVAQAVVDEGEKLACRGDPADGTASVLGDTVMERGDGGGATLAAHGLDRRPAHQPRALFICGSCECQGVWPVVLGWLHGCRDRGGPVSKRPAGVQAQGGQSRPGRRPARRGSLDGPFSCCEDNDNREAREGFLGGGCLVVGG